MRSHTMQNSAEIFRFPSSVRTREQEADASVAPSTTPVAAPTERLLQALRMLEMAQSEQRAAIARWREAISDLSNSVKNMGQTLSSYQSNLNIVAEKLKPND